MSLAVGPRLSCHRGGGLGAAADPRLLGRSHLNGADNYAEQLSQFPSPFSDRRSHLAARILAGVSRFIALLTTDCLRSAPAGPRIAYRTMTRGGGRSGSDDVG